MADPPHEFYKPAPLLRDLQFLEELEQNPNISQRELSHKLGIALGVTNACLKKLARRGWIKIKKIPPRRIGYYLTPPGFAEKTQLTYRFLTNTLQQYTLAKREIANKLLALERVGIKRIVLYGVSDQMEIAYVTLQGVNLELVGIVDDDPAKQGGRFFHLTISKPEEILRWDTDAILITSIEDRKRIRERLSPMLQNAGLRIESL